jgi:hypothetical protein
MVQLFFEDIISIFFLTVFTSEFILLSFCDMFYLYQRLVLPIRCCRGYIFMAVIVLGESLM